MLFGLCCFVGGLFWCIFVLVVCFDLCWGGFGLVGFVGLVVWLMVVDWLVGDGFCLFYWLYCCLVGFCLIWCFGCFVVFVAIDSCLSFFRVITRCCWFGLFGFFKVGVGCLGVVWVCGWFLRGFWVWWLVGLGLVWGWVWLGVG